MQYELRLSSPSLDVLPLVAIADAVARAAATGGDTPFHKPTYQGKFRKLLEWVVGDAREGRLAVTDQDGKPGTFDEVIQRAKNDGTYSEAFQKPSKEALQEIKDDGLFSDALQHSASTDVDLDATHALCVYTTLKNLNAWASEQGNEFLISRVGWIDERGWVESDGSGCNRSMNPCDGAKKVDATAGNVTLSDKRCIELARTSNLGVAEWVELTGVGVGDCGPFRITFDSVSFVKHELKDLKTWPQASQVDMLRENMHEPLVFPCTPERLIAFIDSDLCSIHGCFSVPGAFRLAVAESVETSKRAAKEKAGTDALGEPQSQDNPPTTVIGTDAVALQRDELEETPKERRAKYDLGTERGCRRGILEIWDDVESLHGPSANGRHVLRILTRRMDPGVKTPSLKTVRNRLKELRNAKLIP